MKPALLLLSSAAIASAGFGPNVRIDHQFQPNYICHLGAITIGPGAPSNQPLYVAFQGDTLLGGRSDIWFQKSLDGGRTWLVQDLLIKRGDRYAFHPDITTDAAGNVYIEYVNKYIDTVGTCHYHISCVRSGDGGATWSAPAKVGDETSETIGSISIVADTAGNLFVAWNQWYSRVFSSVSTDKGATWSPRVCVDDDTLTAESYHPEVFVQPGTNHYLVAATTDRWIQGRIRNCAYLYRSTDRGLTFQPGVRLDTFGLHGWRPRVVADRDHIVCSYLGFGRTVDDTVIAEARTFYTQPDTWGTPSPVTNLDSLHALYYGGTLELAISDDGRVHTALMVQDQDTVQSRYDVYYTSSSDHGISWSDIELVTDDDATVSSWYPDIGADMAGHAYVVWEDVEGAHYSIMFSTNNPIGIAEETPSAELRTPNNGTTVVRNVLCLPEAPGTISSPSILLDISGRKVFDLKPGVNDVRTLAPGVYVIEAGPGLRAKVVKLK
jgi:hypothetical protein